MPVTKAEAMLEKRRTDLGRAIMADEEFCTALHDMREQVKVWDAMGTVEALDKVLNSHGVNLNQVVQQINDRKLIEKGWTRHSKGHWLMPEESE